MICIIPTIFHCLQKATWIGLTLMEWEKLFYASKVAISLITPCWVLHQFSSIQLLSHVWLQHARLPCPSPTPGDCSNSCPRSQWCHPTISSSVIPFSSCLLYFPASRSFLISQFFISGHQNIKAIVSASVLPMNIQGRFPLGWTGLISLKSKGLPRVFSNTKIQKHQFFGIQLSLWSNSHIQTWLLEKP